jgi:hypothetical protein
LNYIAFIGTNRAAVQALPAAAGTDPTKPPAIACYTTDSLSSDPVVWLRVDDGYTSTSMFCGLVFSDGVWSVVLSRGIPGYWAAFVVLY